VVSGRPAVAPGLARFIPRNLAERSFGHGVQGMRLYQLTFRCGKRWLLLSGLISALLSVALSVTEGDGPYGILP
jgi:hypothetical protein